MPSLKFLNVFNLESQNQDHIPICSKNSDLIDAYPLEKVFKRLVNKDKRFLFIFCQFKLSGKGWKLKKPIII